MAAVNPAAAAEGLLPGMPLADAQAILPGLAAAEEDPAGDLRTLARLADWCTRYTPWCAPGYAGDAAAGSEQGIEGSGREPGGAAGLLLDVTGCAHLFGGEAALLEDLVSRLTRLGYAARAALAETPGAAWGLARFATSERRPWCLVAAGGLPAALAPLSPVALRLSSAQSELLQRLGLTRIGDLYDLPRATLEPRFGRQLAARLDQALGRSAEAIAPRIATPPPLSRRIFAEPICSTEAIAASLQSLLTVLCEQLQMAHLGARRLELRLFRVDGSVRSLALGTSRPVRDPAHLMRLFTERLERIDPGFGIEVMALAATTTEPLSALQLALTGAPPPRVERAGPGPANARTPAQASSSIGASSIGASSIQASSIGAPTSISGASSAGDLGELIDRLSNRLGPCSVTALVPQESHLPERAVRAQPPLPAGFGKPAGPLSAAWRAWRKTAARTPRPTQLLRRPEPVEALALLPDHPPAQFRWRRVRHKVLRAEGPERIAPEWWRDQDRRNDPGASAVPPDDPSGGDDDQGISFAATPRDYFRVEDEDGRRFWLYRSGQRWFLHGLFA